MGVCNNEAVLATTGNDDVVVKIKAWTLKQLPCQVSLFAFVPGCVNGKTTICLVPCGSKKGWPDDFDTEELRDRFIELLKSFDYEDGSSPIAWVEVGYGEYGQKVLRGNCVNCYGDAEYAIETETRKEVMR